MTERGEPDAKPAGSKERALVPYPLTDADDIAHQIGRDAVRVARGEMSDVAFYEKYRGEFESE